MSTAKLNRLYKCLAMVLALSSAGAGAVDLEWSGLYRAEFYSVSNSALQGGGDKLFGLHHLILRPKIVAADGLTIYSRFDVFNSDAYPDSQLGQFFGHGVNDYPNATSGYDTNALSSRAASETIAVTELYLTLNQEFGSLVVGRVPLQFGLGITYNAGNGMFDHWLNTEDLVGYKISLSNFYFMPMFGRAHQGDIYQRNAIDDYMIQAQYESPENDLQMGVFYQARKGNPLANDAPKGTAPGGTLGGTADPNNVGDINFQKLNIFVLKNTETARVGVEAGLQSGKTGIMTSSGENVAYNGFAVAGEGEYRPQGSKWKFGAKTGFASGDNPGSDDKFEGFIYNRNYNVAMLLFNYSLGKADFLRTGIQGGGPQNGVNDGPDVEAISNVFYFAPYARYQLGEKTDLEFALASGWLNENPLLGTNTAGDLGYELDVAFSYTPKSGVTWVNQIGLLAPGSAWKGGGQFDSKFAFGVSSRAAVSF